MCNGQSPAPKRSKAEGGLSAPLSGGASSPAPAREGVDVSPQGGEKAKGKQRYRRSIFDRMLDTTDESSDDKCPGDCGGADHPPLENEFHEDESSHVLGISGRPGPCPTIGVKTQLFCRIWFCGINIFPYAGIGLTSKL